MPAKFIFTRQELLEMIKQSPAAQSLTSEQLLLLVQKCQDPNSDSAQQVYSSLNAERQKYKKLRQNFLQQTNNLYLSFNAELEDMKQDEIRSTRENAEMESKQAEEQIAEDVLKQIQ